MRSRPLGWISLVGGAVLAAASMVTFAWPGEASAKPKPVAAKPAADGAKKAEPKKVAAKKKEKGKDKDGKGKKKEPKKSASKKAPAKPCVGASVTLDRNGLEPVTLPLLDCKDGVRPEARAELSVLARPFGVQRPAKVAAPAKDATEVAPGIRLVDDGLVARLASVAKQFPGKTITVVSGYRPGSKGSQHQAGKALDVRVGGVGNDELVKFCKTLGDTACGFYPNSSFVHVDVREKGTGSLSWIDASGPGEAPRYVSAWPPPEEPLSDKKDDKKSDKNEKNEKGEKKADDKKVAEKADERPHVCGEPPPPKAAPVVAKVDLEKDPVPKDAVEKNEVDKKAEKKAKPEADVRMASAHDEDGPVKPAVLAKDVEKPEVEKPVEKPAAKPVAKAHPKKVDAKAKPKKVAKKAKKAKPKSP